MAGFVLPSDADESAAPASAGSTGSQPFVLPSDMDEPNGGGPPPSALVDAAKGFGSGLATGEAGLAALPRTIHDSARYGADWVLGQTAGRVSNYLKTGSADAVPASEVAARSARVDQQSGADQWQAPSFEEAKSAVEDVTGPLYQAQTAPGRYAQKIGEYIPSTVLLPGSGVGKAAMAIGSGVGDEGAGSLTKGSWAEPYARAAGAIIGGGLGAVSEGLTKSVVPAFSKQAAERQATNIVQNAVSDPAALREAAAADVSGALPSNKLLPGWNETSAQRFPDQGLLDLEKAVQTRNPSAFVENEHGTGTAQQNQAGETFVKSLQRNGDPTDVPALFRQQRRSIEDMHDALAAKTAAGQQQDLTDIGGNRSATAYGRDIANEVGPGFHAAQQDARQQVSALGGTDRPDVYGSVLRNSARTSSDAANEGLRKLFDAIPKDVSAPIGPLKEFAAGLYRDMDPAREATVSPLEHKISGAIAAFPDNVPFSSARNIDMLITSSMRQELRQNGRTPAYARMTQMKGAWEDAIDGALSDRSAQDAKSVAEGTIAPENTVATQLKGLWGDQGANVADASGVAARTGTGSGGPSGAGSISGSGSVRTGRSPEGGARQAPGDQGIPEAPLDDDTAVTRRPTTPPFPRPQDLSSFIRSAGGMRDPGGDLASMGMGHLVARPGVGLRPDAMRQAAAEAGYLGGDTAHAMRNTDINDLLNAIGSDRPVHSAFDADAAHAWGQYDELRGQYHRVSGPGSKPAMPPKAPLSAYSRDDAYPPGMAPGERDKLAGHRPVDQDTLDKLAAAKTATKEIKAAFGKGPVGAMLKSDGTSGSYKMLDSAVPDAVFPKGPKGWQGVQAYRQAIGDDPAAAGALHNYAASTLRKAALDEDGTLNPGKFANWRSAYDPAFRALPAEVQNQFNTAGNAAKALERFGDFSPGMRPHEVPEVFFSPGPAGADGVNHLRSLIGASKADPILSDYAASQVKERALNADGTINPARLKRFADAHADALSEFPALKGKLSSVSKASDLLGRIAVSRKQALQDLENGAAKKFMNLDDGTEVRDAVGRMIDANNVTGARKLMQAVSVDPKAKAGVLRAAAEAMANKFLSEASQAGTTGSKDLMRGTFLNTLADKRAALQEFFDKGQMQGFEMLKNGIRSSNLTTNASKIKGSPNTAADYIRAMKFEPEKREPLLRKIVEASIAGSEVGGEHGSFAAAALAVGNHVKNAIRDAGMRKTYEVVERAMLDPEFLKALVAKAPMVKDAGSEITLANRVARYSMFRAAQGTRDQGTSQRNRYAFGGSAARVPGLSMAASPISAL